MPGLGLPNLQGVYDASTGPTHIAVNTTVGGLVLEDNGTIGAPPDPVFRINDASGNPRLNATRDYLDIGFEANTANPADNPLIRMEDGVANSIQWWPTDRTFTAAQGPLMRLGESYELDYVNVSFGGLNLQATIQHNQAGFAFNHGLLFNHGNTYRNELNVAANYGPLQGFIDQPTLQVNRTTAGTITMGLFRSFLSQPRMIRTTTNGTLSITTVGQVQCFGNVQTGAIITTWNRVQLGPFTTPATGTITTYRAILIADETQPTSITGIRCEITGTSKTFIQHVGTSPSTFAGDIHMNNGVSLVLGSVGASRVELLRSAAGIVRMIGVGGTNNEGLDWDFDGSADAVQVTSSTGASLWLNTTRLSLGTTNPGGSNNWHLNFAAPAQTISLAGDFANVLNSAGASHTINAALGLFYQQLINAPSGTIGTGSVTDAGVVRIQGNVGVGANRYGLYILSNPSGGAGNNQPLRVENGESSFNDVEIRGLLNPSTGSWAITNRTVDRTYDANSTTLNEVADALATLVEELISKGVCEGSVS